MKRSVIRLSLILLVVHYNYGFSLPRIKAENPEDIIDLVEDVDIDPRKDEPVNNSYSTEKPKHGKRQRRDIPSERIPSKRRSKRTYFRNWVPFTSDLSRLYTQKLPEYAREIITEQKPIVQPHYPKYAYLVGHLSSTLDEKDNKVLSDNESNDELDSESSIDESDIADYTEEPYVVEYLEYDELDENNSSEDDADMFIEQEKDFNKDFKPEASGFFLEITTIRNNKDSGENSKVSDNPKDDLSDSIALDHVSDSDEDSSLLEDEEIEEKEDGKDCDESDEDTYTNFDDILSEIHQIFIKEKSTIELSPETIDNPQNFNVLNLLHNVLKEHSKLTNQGIIIKMNSNQPKFLDALRGLFTNIVRNNVVINNHVPVTPKPVDIAAEKDRLNEQNFKEHNRTESPKEKVTPTVDKINEKTNNSNYIDQSKDKDFTPPPLESTTDTAIVKNTTEINKNTSNDTNKLINSTSTQVSSTTPAMETLSSSIGIEKPTTPEKLEPTTSNPNKIENNATNEKEDGADVNNKIDFMLDLINNENFWKFMGDLGGKYLESLMAHTESVIKKQIETQVKEHLDALNKYDEKLLEKKEKVKENNPVKEPKENAGGKNREAKNINETVTIKTHNLFGNTVGNDKVTNVYVFYANEHIDEIMKNIHEIANKTKPVNSTNIFTFITNHLEVNNGTSKPATPIVNEVTTELPSESATVTQTPVAQTTTTEVQTEITQHTTHSEATTNADLTTESVISKGTTIADTTIGSSTERNDINHKNNGTSLNTNTIDHDKDKVTTESVKPVTDNISSTAEVSSVVSDTTIESTTEKHDVTSNDDKAKGTTESMEPVTSDISSTTEVTSVVSDTTIESTTEKHDVTSDDDKAIVTTESVKPVTSAISSTTEITSTVSDTTIESTTEKHDVTSDDDKAKGTTESMEPVTSDISSTTEVTSVVSDTTIESTTEKHDVISDDDKAKVTTESMKPVTSVISTTTEVTSTVSDKTIESTTEKNNVTSDDDKAEGTTESMEPVTSDISSTTEVTSVVSDTTIESTTEKHDVISDDDKAKVTTESMKPVTGVISTTTEVNSTVSDKTIESTTEKNNVTSEDDKAKVTTESMKPVTSDISSTTEVTSVASDTTIESTTEKHDVTSDDDTAKVTTECIKPVTSAISSTTEVTSTVSDTTIESTTEEHDFTSDDDKAKVTTESMKPVTDSINSSTEFASHDTASFTDHTESDLRDISTTKSIGQVDEENSPKSTTKLSSDDGKTDISTTDSVTNNIKLTTEAVTTETVDVSVDQADKNHTILNLENSNSTVDHSEILSTTESPEHKIDSIATQAVTEKTSENTKSTNDESNITTEKSELTKADTEVKETTESTTEDMKHK